MRLFGSPAKAGHSERPLRILVAASLIFPLIVFAIAAFLAYDAQFKEAQGRLGRTVDIVHEHASKVFDTFETSERFMEALFEDQTDAQIREREKYFSDRLRSVIDQLPQLRDLWVIDADGHPLVSGTIYPMPPDLSLSDRDYFKAHKEKVVDAYVSEVVEARAADTNFFAVTRKRVGKDGKFNGVYLVSIAPEYFTEFYARLPRDSTSIASLIRTDGAVLARYPISNERRVAPSAAILTAAQDNPVAGFAQGVSPIDGVERMIAYRLLPKQGVYVVTGLETNLIKGEWLEAISRHLYFGIPATFAMFGLAIMALLRTRQEATAFRQLREETLRRHSTELALQQAQKMEAVGQLTGGIAHDFNNLLTIINGNLDTIRRRLSEAASAEPLRDLAAKLTQPLERAMTGAKSAAQLTHRLLAFSRRQPLKPTRVDINGLVASLSELLRRTLGEGVNVETVLAGGLWPAFADVNQVENALVNLAINARDAMPDGGRLTIETANVYLDEAYARRFNEVAAGQYVMLSVSDSGTGIPPDVLEKVFEPFFTTKPVGQGSGLGLAMVHGFVKQSGGHIRIYSEVGQGTTVKIYLPRMIGEDAGAAVPAGTEPALLPLSGARSQEAVLLVEDNDGVREYATSVLSELGYTILAARDGDEALAILERSPRIDILFTDVVLPGSVNGRELANRVLAKLPGLPVLYTTGYTRNAIIHHGRLDADVQLLGKPYTEQDLAMKLRELLDGLHRRQGTPKA
jgi:two-component system NtrC family sensor kinase